ncbi:hypothetical protein G6Z94_19055 [Vibrio aestuarianus]|uniref:hypothetical protein n=1 Tax=Vibrio aestuarianus TaxID=28171 RepID=UPI001594E1CD|nr:hypothetical protein [Vibrio aestuarianus]NGZ19366.1 hypothetical protein [Vibrio aestuarianus]
MIVVDVPTLTKSLVDSGVPEKKAAAIAMGINQAIRDSNIVSKNALAVRLKDINDKFSQKLYAVTFFSLCMNALMLYVVVKGEY